jgi:hypothetical protein
MHEQLKKIYDMGLRRAANEVSLVRCNDKQGNSYTFYHFS